MGVAWIRNKDLKHKIILAITFCSAHSQTVADGLADTSPQDEVRTTSSEHYTLNETNDPTTLIDTGYHRVREAYFNEDDYEIVIDTFVSLII